MINPTSDYETVEGACMAIDKMNGKMFGGRPIKVGRPQGYNTDILKQMAHPKSRIYVANIHEIITEDDLKDLFSGFGRVKAVAMPPDLTTKKHKGYAFVEFERQSAAQNALSCMDEFLLGDRHIKISPGIINNPMPEGMSLLPRNNVKIPSDIRNIANAINKTLGKNLDWIISNELVGISDSAAERGVLVVLRNMISADEINDPELEQELCQELEKFGIVRSLDFSVQPADNKADVLVYFDTEESASEARQSLNGRYFGGNQIEAV